MTAENKSEFDLGYDSGYKIGFAEGRYKKFITPLKQRILIGLLVAITIIFSLFTIGFLGSIFITGVVTGIIGTIICGLIAGTSAGAAYYFVEDMKI